MAQTQKAVWKEAAIEKIGAMFDLLALVPMARTWQTTEGRAAAYLETAKVRISKLMRGSVLHRMASKRSFAQLTPNVEMGKDDAGRAKYLRLVARYGAKKANLLVERTTTETPEVEILVRTEIGDKVSRNKVKVPASTTIVYKFVGVSKSTAQKLEWTEVLGNRIGVRIGPIPANYKAGEAIKGHEDD